MQITTNGTTKNAKGTFDCTKLSENKKTLWVKLVHDGNIIKRHKIKHNIIS